MSEDTSTLISKVKDEDETTDNTSVDLSEIMEASEFNNTSFNEVDYAAMLINTHIRLAVKDLAKSIKFTNHIIVDLRNIILNDESGSSQRIVSELYVKYPSAHMDALKQKLDFYNTLAQRDDINHYLTLLNARIKRNVFDSSLATYFDDKNLDSLIGRIDDLTENIHSAVIPFTDLDGVPISEIKSSFDPANMLESSVNIINECSHYDALLKSQLVIVAAPPGVGKSQYLINETYKHASSGYKVVYLAMGDALTSDFTIKLGCIHFNVAVDEFIADIEKYMADEDFKRVLSNVKLSVVSAGEVSSSDVRRYYKADPELSSADVFIFDYDSNFEELAKMDMYSAHDKIYNNVYALARLIDPKLVYIASQVKSGYYNSEFIPLNALAESSRKQAIADFVVTISGIRHDKQNCGIINLVKVRRGRLGFTPYMLAKSGAIVETDMQLYRTTKAQIKANKLTEEEG